jgi:hypothetical protein
VSLIQGIDVCAVSMQGSTTCVCCMCLLPQMLPSIQSPGTNHLGAAQSLPGRVWGSRHVIELASA